MNYYDTNHCTYKLLQQKAISQLILSLSLCVCVCVGVCVCVCVHKVGKSVIKLHM